MRIVVQHLLATWPAGITLVSNPVFQLDCLVLRARSQGDMTLNMVYIHLRNTTQY